MPKNTKLHEAIGQLRDKKDSEIPIEDRINAIDALLMIDLTEENDDAFRQAVVDHAKVWKEFGDLMKCRKKWEGVYGMRKEVDDLHYFQEDDFLDPEDDLSFIELQQKAAEERVKLGLKNDSEEDKAVLLNILKYNEEECRAYLATRDRVLTQVPGWEASTPNPDINKKFDEVNKGQKVLTEDSIGSIKEHAAQLILMKLLKNAPQNKLDALDKLIKAINENNELNFLQNAKTLGYPVDDPQSSATLSEIFTNNKSEIKKVAEERTKEFKHTNALKNLDEVVRRLDNEWILGKKDLLSINCSTEEHLFIARLLIDPKFEHISRDDIKHSAETEVEKDIQKKLCERYLPAKLEKDGIGALDQLQAALKATTPEALTDALKDGVPDHDNIITQGVTKDNMVSLQVALLKNHIKKLNPDQLDSLVKASNLQEFKTKMALAIGTDVDFIKDTHLPALKEEARIQQFKALVTAPSAARFGEKTHEQLIAVFNKLPHEKQLKLLENKENLPFIFKANDKDVLQFYLGKKDSLGKDLDMTALLEENKRNADFQQLHNAALAKHLYQYTPPITLNDQQIKNINEVLLAQRDLDDKVQYGALLDVLCTQCQILDKTGFCKSLDFNKDTGEFELSKTNQGPIKDQQMHNTNLLDRLDDLVVKAGPPDTEANQDQQRLIGVLLRLEKTAEFTVENIDEVMEAFNNSSSLSAFLEQPNVAPFKDALSRELTQAEFRSIKEEQTQNLFKGKDNAPMKDAVVQLKGDLEKLQQVDKEILKHKGNLSSLQKLDEEASAFAQGLKGKSGKVLRETQAHYKGLNKECINIIDHLQHSLEEVKARQHITVPPVLKNPPSSDQDVKDRNEIIKDVEKLKKELAKEEELIERELRYYRDEVQPKLSKILKNIENVMTGSQKNVYMPEGVVIYCQDRAMAKNPVRPGPGSIKPEQIISAKGGLNSTIILANQNEDQLFKSTGKPGPNQVICFDKSSRTQYLDPKDNTPKTLDVTRRMTYDPDYRGEASATLKGDGIHAARTGKFELINSPIDYDNLPDDVRQELLDEEIQKYMQDAVQILKNMDPPPSKDNPIVIKSPPGKEREAALMWTALVVLGEKNKNMQFPPEAIVVRGGSGFNPLQQRQKGMFGRDTGFAPNSIYEQHFKPRENLIKDTIDDLVKETKENKEQAKVGKDVDKQIQKQTHIKDGVTGLRDKMEHEAEERQKQAGVSSNVARMTSGGK
ncbi:hypothetical protein [Legionella sainthelensi]|uniref:hypothetical protein n=1 Tax=Legionella sainthelensi TaxID=28087 RepID=UPI000EF2ADFD|nr:hypothetical protein [Legionella sainthelensi]AUH71854.2 hypothetical protein CAB17_07065 [Legionella sainthelensi]